jgi:hypothetical protein
MSIFLIINNMDSIGLRRVVAADLQISYITINKIMITDLNLPIGCITAYLVFRPLLT